MGERRPLSMTRRVAPLIAAQAGLVAVLVVLGRADAAGFGRPERVVALAAAFALVGLMPMHLEFGRSACTLTLVEAILVLAFFAVGPLGVIVAAGAGEAVACLTHRQSILKVVYNAVATALGAAIAALAFVAMAGPHPVGTGAWWPALVSVACFAVVTHVSTSWVLSVVGEETFERVLVVSAGLAAAASAVSGSVGLALRTLSLQGGVAPFLLAPLIAVIGLETRRAMAQRAQQLRFERLSAASARTTHLQGFSSALAQAAAEARSLITGSAAVCCAPGNDGRWRGSLVDDSGAQAAPEAMVAAVVALIGDAAGREVSRSSLSVQLRQALPPGETVVLAGTTVSASTGATGGIALAVFREIGADNQGSARSEVLWAFVFHAALITTNALLFERVEEALRRQIDLNRQKDEFVAAVSHELRTPLASLLGSVQTLSRLEGRLDVEARGRFFGIASRQGLRLQRLIEDLLLTASVEHRKEPVEVDDVDLVTLVHDVADDLAEQTDGRLVVRIDGPVKSIRTDEHKLRQVLVNLVDNATKYAPDGIIELLAAEGTIGDAERVLIRVVDHGPGIAPADRARAFERFVQLDGSSTRARGGTGLGLYLCARITELLDATLRVSDTPGGGATFCLSLPVDLGADASPDRRAGATLVSATPRP